MNDKRSLGYLPVILKSGTVFLAEVIIGIKQIPEVASRKRAVHRAPWNTKRLIP